MDLLDIIVNFLYADGNVLLCLCNIVSFIFGLEAMAYLVSIVSNIAKSSK